MLTKCNNFHHQSTLKKTFLSLELIISIYSNDYALSIM